MFGLLRKKTQGDIYNKDGKDYCINPDFVVAVADASIYELFFHSAIKPKASCFRNVAFSDWFASWKLRVSIGEVHFFVDFPDDSDLESFRRVSIAKAMTLPIQIAKWASDNKEAIGREMEKDRCPCCNQLVK